MPIPSAKSITASITTAIAPAAATIVNRGCGHVNRNAGAPAGACSNPFEATASAIFSELFVNDILFRVGLVKLRLIALLIGIELADCQVVDRVFFLVVLFVLIFIDIAGTGNLVDRHLTEHRAQVRSSFQRLLFIKVLHLFDGAGMERRVVVLFIKSLFNKSAGTRNESVAAGASEVRSPLACRVVTSCGTAAGSSAITGIGSDGI